MIPVLAFLTAWLVWTSNVEAAVVFVPCTESGIDAAVTSLKAGDILEIGPGTCTWSSVHTWNFTSFVGNIWIRGSSDGSTVIQDDGTSGVLDEMLLIRAGSNMCLRISNITFTSTVPATSERGSAILMTGNITTSRSRGSSCIRLDHLTFTNWPRASSGADMLSLHEVMGVADNITYTNTVGPTIFMGVQFATPRANEPSVGDGNNGDFGNAIWSENSYPGTPYAFILEDSSVTAEVSTGVLALPIMNTHFASRHVFRYNNFYQGHPTFHAVESTARRGSNRWFEYYKNTIDMGTTIPQPWVMAGAGTGIVWANAFSGSILSIIGQLNDRDNRDTGLFGACDGTMAYDSNDTSGPLGGSLHEVGSHTGADGALTMIDNTKSWSPSTGFGKWGAADGSKFFLLLNLRTNAVNPTQTPYCPTCYFVAIDSSTTNQLLYTVGNSEDHQTPQQGGNANIDWNTGDNYQIRKIIQCIDQPGTGQGIKYVGPNTTDPPSPLLPANNEVEPIHIWENTYNGGAYSTVGISKHYASSFQTTAKPNYTPYTYRCPIGGCAATGKNTCNHPRGCGHPLRWENSRLNVRTRPAVTIGPVAASRPAVTTRPNSE